MGFSHAGNVALIRCFTEGIETTIEVIVPSPWFPEAVKLLNQYPGVDVGVHLALSSEWENVKYRPVAFVPSLVDADGYFFPFLWPHAAYPGQSLLAHDWNLAEVEKEFRSQIELARKHIPRISHVSGHMGCTHISSAVTQLVKNLAREYGLDVDLSEHGVVNAKYEGTHGTSEEKLESFLAMLNKLEKGKTYLFVDHPGLATPELRAIHHKGYEDVATDRQGVTDTWTHPRVKAEIERLHIELISYRDLRK